MNTIIVYFEYFTNGEIGSDKYRFSAQTDAIHKMEELKCAIKSNFCDCPNAETIHEPNFFGIIDHATGDYAKVFLQTI